MACSSLPLRASESNRSVFLRLHLFCLLDATCIWLATPSVMSLFDMSKRSVFAGLYRGSGSSLLVFIAPCGRLCFFALQTLACIVSRLICPIYAYILLRLYIALTGLSKPCFVMASMPFSIWVIASSFITV